MAKNKRASGNDPLFWNKIFAGVLGTLLIWRVILEIGGLIYVPQESAEAAYLTDIPQIGSLVASGIVDADLPTLLAYMRTFSHSPVNLPAVTPEP